MVKKMDKSGIEPMPGGGVAFEGPAAVDVYRLLSTMSGAALYLSTGIKPTRMHTPTRMRDVLNGYSGSSAKNLKAALRDCVVWSEVALGKPCDNPCVLEAAGLER